MSTSIRRLAYHAKAAAVARFDALKGYIWSTSRRGRDNQRRLSALRREFVGRRCFVLGNGPSLLKCDLGALKGEVTICSNAQYLIWDKMGFVPTFLTVEDRLVAEDRAEELIALDGVVKIFPRDLTYCLRGAERAIFINFVRSYKPFPRFSHDFERVVYWGGTVSYLNLQLAYYLGFSEIYLIGFDHEYKMFGKMKNCVITSDSEDVNHIHPDYFGKGYRWHDPDLGRMELSYREARRFLDAHGIAVRNATIGGKLDVFERVEYSALFRQDCR